MKSLVIVAILLVIGHNLCEGKIHVTVYYESLCPDSIRFISNQLYPNLQDPGLKDFIDVLFVPFGKSSSSSNGDTVEFVCQHGPRECEGNRLQSCVLHQIPDRPADQLNFVACQMNFQAEGTGRVCAISSNVDWQSVQSCYGSSLGTELQLTAEQLTNNVLPQTNFVPTIVFNHAFDKTLHQRALSEFRTVACELLKYEPQACH
ncbi:GILT-like protein 1 [Lutzomyia longipalpis]|uniref:Putative gamma-interferon inducible lysosomal thiol reductase n=1 Tax=Lutzomyia longipalpis TaxID=7200 RepID=A0A1B0CXC7_LUTLO|nr:GILT-like protein 1 [Lutzomyia longipalpis]